jgi:hypothetical protein
MEFVVARGGEPLYQSNFVGGGWDRLVFAVETSGIEWLVIYVSTRLYMWGSPPKILL